MAITISVHNNYGGRLTNEERIEPGEYEDTDPRLFGLAKYLVENGHAEVIAESLPEEVIAPIVPTDLDRDPELDPLTDEELALIAQVTKTEVVTKQLSDEELAAPVAKTAKKGGGK